MHVNVILDPEFTAKAFYKDPFRWVDPNQFRRMLVGFGRDALVEINCIDGYPTLFNGISMDGKSYLLVQILPDGSSLVIGSSSCRHLLMNERGVMSLSTLPAHQSVMASVLTLSQRDVSSFSPVIQVRAIADASSSVWGTMKGEWRHDLLTTMLFRMQQDFNATPDVGRKRYLFYYMLFIAKHVSQGKRASLFQYFNSASPEFVYLALTTMEDYRGIHDAVREAGSALLLRAASDVFSGRYCQGSSLLEINGKKVSLVDSSTMLKQVRCVETHHTGAPRSSNQIGYRAPLALYNKRHNPPPSRLGMPVKRKARKRRKQASTDQLTQSLITDWSRGKHAARLASSNNKNLGAEFNRKVLIMSNNRRVLIMSNNRRLADQFIDYLLAVSGDVGEWVAQEWQKPVTMKDRREFVKAIYKRAELKLSAKAYGEWVSKFITSMVKDEFLNKPAGEIVTNWTLAHGSEATVKHAVYKRLMDKLANVYVPAR